MAGKRLLCSAKQFFNSIRHPSLPYVQVCYRSKKAVIAAKEREEAGLEPIDEWAYNHIEQKNGLIKPTHSVEEQIAYMNSEVFAKSYEGLPIFHWYRRNIIGQFKFQPPPRLYCIDKHGRFNINHACPVCRDEYLFFDYRNPKLIEMFLFPGTDQPIDILVSGLCREQYINLKAQFLKAKECGTITFSVEFRHFNYKDWYPQWKEESDLHEDKVISRKNILVEEILADPQVLFPTHNRDINTDWDEWWLRHKKFSRTAR